MLYWYYIPKEFITSMDPYDDDQLLELRRQVADYTTLYQKTRHPETREPNKTVAFSCDGEEKVSIIMAAMGIQPQYVWREIIDPVIPQNYPLKLILESADGKRGKIKKLKSQKVADLILQYSDKRKAGAEKQKLDLETSLQEQRNYAKSYMASLTEAYQQIEELNKKIEFNRSPELIAKKAREEIRQIRRMHCVRSVSLHDATLHIETDSLQSAGVVYGEFIIEIQISPTRIYKIQNKTPIEVYSRVYHHPHIYYDGSDACWGNIGGDVAELQAREDVVGLIGIILDFITSFRPEGRNSSYQEIFYAFRDRQNAEDSQEQSEKKELAQAV